MPEQPIDSQPIRGGSRQDRLNPLAGEARGEDWPRFFAGGEGGLPAGLRGRLPQALGAYLRSLAALGRWQLLITVGLMTLSSLTEGFGVALLFPILQVAGFNMTNEGHVGHYTSEVRLLLRLSGLAPSLWLPTLLMLFMLLMAVRSLFSRAQSVRALRTVLRFEISLSRKLYQAVVHADWLFLVRRRSSDFMHALTAEMARVSIATYQFISALSSAILALVYAAIAFKLSTITTLMVLTAGALLLLATRRWMRAVHESGEALSETMSAVYAAATEHLQNLKVIKTYGGHAADFERFASLEDSAMEQSLRNTRNQAASAFWFEAGSLAVLGGVVFVSLHILRVGPASILLLLAIFTRLMPQLARGNSYLQAFFADLPAFENIAAILKECEEHGEEWKSGEPAPVFLRELSLESVSFQYEAGRPPVLDGLSLVLRRGEITAIVGASGAGKSTIADLVNGLLAPSSGSVRVDGVELTRKTAESWRRQVGYVAQDTLLFHETVRANLLWAQPSASQDDLEEALTLAAAEFVFEIPEGLDAMVGDRGILLSNGQRQRIALARALVRKPSLLILDEATGSLDVENEGRILDAVERLKRRTAVLLIAHRSSAVKRADTICVLEEGRITARGPWREFAASSSSQGGMLFRLEDSPA